MSAMDHLPTTRATINDVARAAGVSRQTVSNVVNRPERVAPNTRERVQAEIERLGYRPSVAAQSLRQQRAGAVGIELAPVSPGASYEIPYGFVSALSNAARNHSCHIVTFGADPDGGPTLGYEHMSRARLVDAFVLADTRHGDERPGYLAQQGIPWAAFGRVWDDPTFTAWADVDGRAGTRTAVEHLLTEGYERIGYLGWPEGSATGDDRLSGWRDALRDAARLDEELVGRTEQNLDDAIAAADGLLDAVGRGGAVVAVSDLVAVGVLEAARARGWVPGTDIGIVGFDGSAVAAVRDLATIDQPLAVIADSLLTMIGTSLSTGTRPEQGVLVAPSLVVRSSARRG